SPLASFSFNDPARSELYTLSLHDALPISDLSGRADGGDPGRTASGTFACSRLCESQAVSKASERLRNGADELDAPRAPSSQRGPGPTRVNSEIVSGSDSRSGSGA